MSEEETKRITFRPSVELRLAVDHAADRLYGGNISKLVTDSLTEKLERLGMLQNQDTERNALIAEMESAAKIVGLDRLREAMAEIKEQALS